jgi:hypothetical protein
MLTDQRTRHELFKRFEELLGPELAGAYMELHPPIDWEQLATKADLAVLEASTRAGMSDLRGEMCDVETRLHGDIQNLDTSLRGEMCDVETRLRGDIRVLAMATRGGLYALYAEVRRQFAVMRAGTNEQFATMRAEVSEQFAVMRAGSNEQFAGISTTLRTLRSDFSAQLERTVREALTSQSRHMVLTISAMTLSLMGMMVTLVGLLSGWFPR